MAELLVSKGADVNAKDDYSKTPLNWAERLGYTDMVNLLKRHSTRD